MDWQAIVVLLVVLAAVVYLARRAYLSFKKPACADGCATCPSKGSEGTKGPDQLVQLRVPKKKRKDS